MNTLIKQLNELGALFHKFILPPASDLLNEMIVNHMLGYKRFYRRALLETSDYLKDDCLKVNCTVGVVVSATHCPRHTIQVPESDIGSHFGMLLENMEGSDIIFNVAGEIFHAHKLAMLYFIYRDELNEDELATSSACSESYLVDTLLAKLLAAADEYDLCRLKRVCESSICKDISVNSVGRILALADTYHAMELKAICLRFASENLAAVMQSDGFEYLKANHPSLQSEILKTVASCEEDYSSGGGGKTQSVCAQLSDGEDTNSRR
ncbi:hypothetical protein M8C21_016886, partial [Ambrosia artemisiifolia]